MGKIAEKKMAMTDSFQVFGGRFFAYPSPEILTKHKIKKIPVKATSGVLFIHPKVRFWVAVK